MAEVQDAGPVVVGISACGSERALDWAAAEAGARRRLLRVVHVVRPATGVVDAPAAVPSVGGPMSPAARVLSAAVARVRALAPDVDVQGRLLGAPVVPALLHQARDASLLVLGGSEGGPAPRLRDLLAPPVAPAVAVRSRCPIAVIRRLRTDGSVPAEPCVVVGVADEARSATTLGLAFRAAAQRGAPVLAVHAWSPDVPADLEAVAGCAAAAEARARATLDRALEPWLVRYEDVAVRSRLCRAEPVTALVGASTGAALVVVGAAVRSEVARGRLSRSVGCRVAQRANCPVVVVPAPPVPRRVPRSRRGRSAVRVRGLPGGDGVGGCLRQDGGRAGEHRSTAPKPAPE